MFVGGRIRIRLLNNTPSQREPVSTLHPLRGSSPLGGAFPGEKRESDSPFNAGFFYYPRKSLISNIYYNAYYNRLITQ